MLHLILLVLCWIFVCIATMAEGTRPGTNPAPGVMLQAVFIGTLIWLALEGAYYLIIGSPMFFRGG